MKTFRDSTRERKGGKERARERRGGDTGRERVGTWGTALSRQHRMYYPIILPDVMGGRSAAVSVIDVIKGVINYEIFWTI